MGLPRPCGWSPGIRSRLRQLSERVISSEVLFHVDAPTRHQQGLGLFRKRMDVDCGSVSSYSSHETSAGSDTTAATTITFCIASLIRASHKSVSTGPEACLLSLRNRPGFTVQDLSTLFCTSTSCTRPRMYVPDRLRDADLLVPKVLALVANLRTGLSWPYPN